MCTCWPKRSPRRITSGTWEIRKLNADNVPEWDASAGGVLENIYGVYGGKVYVLTAGLLHGFDVNTGALTTYSHQWPKHCLPGGAGVIYASQSQEYQLELRDVSGSLLWQTAMPPLTYPCKSSLIGDMLFFMFVASASGGVPKYTMYVMDPVSGSAISPVGEWFGFSSLNSPSVVMSPTYFGGTSGIANQISIYELASPTVISTSIDAVLAPSTAQFVGAGDGLTVCWQTISGTSYLYFAEYTGPTFTPYDTVALPSGELIYSMSFDTIYKLFYMIVDVGGSVYQLRIYDTSWNLVASTTVSGIPVLPANYAANSFTGGTGRIGSVGMSHVNQGLHYYKLGTRLYDFDGNNIGDIDDDGTTPYSRVHAAVSGDAFFQTGEGAYL